MNGILDTTVIIHLLRNQEIASEWLDSQSYVVITPITWLEVMEGSKSKLHQNATKSILNKFQIVHTTSSDQKWAMNQLEKFHFSHRIGMNDCQIASVAYRLQIPLYTHNLKHMTPLLGELAQKPY